MVSLPDFDVRPVAHKVLDVIRQLGTDTIFGIPGVHNQELYDALLDVDGFRSVVNRHEQGAAFMADGYSRASGRVGVCFLITGPGLTNAATAIAEAYSDSVPLVCFVTCYSSSDANPGRRLHDLKSQELVLQGLFKESFRLTRHSELVELIAAAFESATSERPGPVAVEIPLDFLGKGVEEPHVADGKPVIREPNSREDSAVEALHAVIRGRRPVVVVGGGCGRGAAEAVGDLVGRLQAPVICTAAGKGVVGDGHPLLVGAWLKTNVIRELARQADPLILLGTEWSSTDLGESPFELPPTTVRVDLDREARPLAGIWVRADVRTTVSGWLKNLEVREPWISIGEIAAIRDRAVSEPRRWSKSAVAYLEAIREVLERDAVVVNDMNTLSYAAVERFECYLPNTFLFPRGYGTLGYALPAAIGAKLGSPGRQVVAVCGDGGFLFTSEELATAVRYGLNLPIIVWNNRSYGAIQATRIAAFGRSDDHSLVNPDFVRLAEAYGCRGVRVSAPKELSVFLDAALKRQQPTIVEINVAN